MLDIFLIHLFIFFKKLHLFIYFRTDGGRAHSSVAVPAEVQEQLTGVDSCSTLWVPMTEFRLLGLATNAFAC